MSIKFNAEGYRDNTAYEAIRSISRHHIRYSSGVMGINLSAFFPCRPEVAKALLSLVASYCPLEDQIEFATFLNTKSRQMLESILRMERRNDHSDFRRRELSQLRQRHRLLNKNIAMFKTMGVRS